MNFTDLPCRAGLLRASALLLVLVLNGCGNGGNGDRDDPPPQVLPSQTDLVWDEGNWDELNWQ